MLKGIYDFSTGGRARVFCANATVTAMGAYTTAAGIGGPLLWNGSAVGGGNGVTAFILSCSYGLTVASTVAGAIGITGGGEQPAAPTSTTAIDGLDGLNYGDAAGPACTAYRIGTVAVVGEGLLVTGRIHTGAITVDTDDDNFVHLGGMITVPTGCWAAVAGSAVLTTSVIQVSLCWAEVPNP
jgi:hypothetical protein